MGLRSVFKKIGKGLKKALPYAALAAPFIPGVGPAIGGVISKVGGLFGGGSSAKSNFVSDPAGADMSEFGGGAYPQQVQVPGQRNGWQSAFGDLAPIALSAGANYLGQRQQNIANAQQAQRQMDFQADQTSTSYQRGVADMKAAGLNPMLAYSQGGAASGGGAQATMGNELGAGANSALQAVMAKQQLQQSDAQIQNIQADTLNKDETTENIKADTLHKYALTSSEGTRNHELAQRVASIALGNTLASETQQANIATAKAGADLRRHEATGAKYGLSEKKVWSGFYDSAVGSKYPYVSKATEQSNSAANVFRKFIPFTND